MAYFFRKLKKENESSGAILGIQKYITASLVLAIFILLFGVGAWYLEEFESYEESARRQMKIIVSAGLLSLDAANERAAIAFGVAEALIEAERHLTDHDSPALARVRDLVRQRLGEGASVFWSVRDNDDDAPLAQPACQAPVRSADYWVWRRSVRGAQPGSRIHLSHLVPAQEMVAPFMSILPRNVTMLLVGCDGVILGGQPDRADWIGRRVRDLLPRLPQDGQSAWVRAGGEMFDGGAVIVEGGQHASGVSILLIAPLSAILVDTFDEAAIILVLLLIGVPLIALATRWTRRVVRQIRLTQQSLEQTVQARTQSLEREIFIGQQQHEELRKFQQAVDASSSIIIITDSKGIIEYANRSYAIALGDDPNDLIGSSVTSLFSVNSAERDQVARAIAAGGHWRGVILSRHKNNSPHWVLTTLAPIFHSNGQISSFIVVGDDVTDQHQQADELRTMRDQAESANRAKDEFLSAMSHELRTPLNAILGFGQLLVGAPLGTLTDRQRSYANNILRSGNTLLRLVNEVLDLAQLQAGEMVMALEPINLVELIDVVLRQIQPQADDHGIQIISNFDRDHLPWVRGDRQRLQQVLTSLLVNAVKFNCPDGHVTIEALPARAGYLRVMVRDTGIGVAPEQMGQLFQPFIHLNADGGAQSGVGIGLAVARKLIEAMGGSIGCISEPGEGSVFWVDLVIVEVASSSRHGDDDIVSHGGKLVKILYVEDIESSRDLMKAILAQDKHANWRLDTVASAEEAIAAAVANPPDLILMDINLPGMSGIEAMAELRQHDALRLVPVIGLSADVMPETVRAGLAAGFVQYLQKPLKIPDLIATLMVYVRGS